MEHNANFLPKTGCANNNPAQFCRCLRSIESAHDHARANGVGIKGNTMRPTSHPPDVILRAYCDLLKHALIFQRGASHLINANVEEIRDLADAMHNIGDLFADYGVWIDDEQYRALYLRPFDKRWAIDGFGLEQFLESRLARYSGNES